ILALDIGTSSVRATLVDEAGTVLARSEVPTPAKHAAGGHVTLDPDTLWPVVANVILMVSRDAHVLAVGVTAQLGIILVDASGHAVSPVLLWADSRARGYAGSIARVITGKHELQTGRRPAGETTAARLLWFAEHHPELLRRSRH